MKRELQNAVDAVVDELGADFTVSRAIPRIATRIGADSVEMHYDAATGLRVKATIGAKIDLRDVPRRSGTRAT